MNSVQSRLVASVVHNGSAWKPHRKLEVGFEEWFKLALLLKNHPALSPPMSMMLSREPATWLKMWWGSFLAGFGPWFDLLQTYRNYSTCTKEWQHRFLQLLSIGLAFVNSLELSWIYWSSLFFIEKWSIGTLSCLLFGI